MLEQPHLQLEFQPLLALFRAPHRNVREVECARTKCARVIPLSLPTAFDVLKEALSEVVPQERI